MKLAKEVQAPKVSLAVTPFERSALFSIGNWLVIFDNFLAVLTISQRKRHYKDSKGSNMQ